MSKLEIKELEDIAPHVKEHLFPEIQDSVEVCIRSHNDDDYNDMWIFGTHLWKNTWNRFVSATSFEECPFDVCGKGNEYKLKIGPYVLRHHRIDQESNLPSGAKAVKAAAQDMYLFGEEWNAPVEIDNIVLAINADVQSGLKEVFIGELKQRRSIAKKYKWGKKISVYLAEGAKASPVETTIKISNMSEINSPVPEEVIPDILMGLDSTITDLKNVKSDSEK